MKARGSVCVFPNTHTLISAAPRHGQGMRSNLCLSRAESVERQHTFGIQAIANQTHSSIVKPHCITTKVVLIRTAKPARRHSKAVKSARRSARVPKSAFNSQSTSSGAGGPRETASHVHAVALLQIPAPL